MIKGFLTALALISLIVTASVDAEEPVKIGVNYGFSGAAQKWAELGRKGIELAVEEINQAGGIGGRPLQIVYEDNQTDPKQSVSAYRKLVSIDRVRAVVASNWSILTNPLVPLATRDRVIVISPTVMDASVEGRSDYFFTMGNRIESLRLPVRKFFTLNPAIKKAAFLCWEDAWGRANLQIWEEEAANANVQVVATICQGDYSSDFRTEVTKVSALKPDVVFVGMYPERVSMRLRELGLGIPIFTTSVVLEPLDDPQFSAQVFEGMHFAYWPSTDDFRAKFRKRFGVDPILEAENHYEAIRSLAKGFSVGGDDLLAAMKNVAYDGVTGRIDFGPSFVVNRGEGSLLRIHERKLEIVQ